MLHSVRFIPKQICNQFLAGWKTWGGCQDRKAGIKNYSLMFWNLKNDDLTGCLSAISGKMSLFIPEIICV